MPIVGVLSQPATWDPSISYVGASYVKWLEAAGARTVPLVYDWPWDKIEDVLSQLNGIMFPGGNADIDPTSQFGAASKRIFEYALEGNMPVWGTCMGFEQLLTYSARLRNASSPLVPVDAAKLMLPLDLAPGARESGLWPALSRETQEVLMDDAVTVNMHVYSIAADDPQVPAFWRILATGLDRKSVPFIALAEALDFPIIAAQFHPEKNLFEYFEPYDMGDFGQLSAAAHSTRAVHAMAELAEHFVQRIIKRRYPNARMDPEVYRNTLGFFRFRSNGVIQSGMMQWIGFKADNGDAVEWNITSQTLINRVPMAVRRVPRQREKVVFM